jgi:hypothetical protein
MSDLPNRPIRDIGWARAHLLVRGKRVRRRAWGLGLRLEVRGDGIWEIGLLGDIRRWEPRQDDIFATDWEPADDVAAPPAR